jgi:hypothetical protein
MKIFTFFKQIDNKNFKEIKVLKNKVLKKVNNENFSHEEFDTNIDNLFKKIKEILNLTCKTEKLLEDFNLSTKYIYFSFKNKVYKINFNMPYVFILTDKFSNNKKNNRIK